MPKVLNKRRMGLNDDGVYIGRPSKWGNPFIIGNGVSRAQAIQLYEEWIMSSPTLLASLPELTGKNLICWCAPAPCHGDVLLKLANPVSQEANNHAKA